MEDVCDARRQITTLVQAVFSAALFSYGGIDTSYSSMTWLLLLHNHSPQWMVDCTYSSSVCLCESCDHWRRRINKVWSETNWKSIEIMELLSPLLTFNCKIQWNHTKISSVVFASLFTGRGTAPVTQELYSIWQYLLFASHYCYKVNGYLKALMKSSIFSEGF